MTDITNVFVRTVGKHFLTLSCVQTVNDIKHPLIFSGFLVDCSGAWFFITAGHILKRIEAALDAGSTFDIWRLDDQMARIGDPMPPIPYDFDIGKWLVLEEEATGLDYAVLYLEEYYVRQNAAAGGEPIRKNAWGNHNQEYDFWALLGMPSESISYDGKTILEAKFSVIPLKRTDAPENTAGLSKNQFYATIDQMGNVKNLDGMSGGPIFSLKKQDGNYHYHVIGVQSAWYSDMKVTVGCPIQPFFTEIAKLVEEAKGGAT